MDEKELLSGRLKELSLRAYQHDHMTHTDFLSLPEQAQFREILQKECGSALAGKLNGAPFVMLGGSEDAERKVVCFLASWQDRETFEKQQETDPEVISCIRIEPVNAKFADALTHRDYLGALMSLGIDRAKTGDILTDDAGAYVMVMKELAGYVIRELASVKHTVVTCKEVPMGTFHAEPVLETVEGSVASERLDAVLAMVWHVSRGSARALVEQEKVIVDGRIVTGSGYDLKMGERVSVRGFGKFRYEGPVASTRKGRLMVRVSKYV